MLLLGQDCLIQVCDAPSLGNVEVEKGRQLLAGFLGHGISPGTEGHEKLSCCVERHITMHHTGKTDTADGRQCLAVFSPDILCQTSVAALQAVPDILQAVGPDVILQTVLPVMGAHSDGLMCFVYQNRLNSGGTELNTEGGAALSDCILYCFAHDISSVSKSFFSLPV